MSRDFDTLIFGPWFGGKTTCFSTPLFGAWLRMPCLWSFCGQVSFQRSIAAFFENIILARRLMILMVYPYGQSLMVYWYDLIWIPVIVVNYCMLLHFIACHYVNSLDIFWILCLIIQSKLWLDHHQPLDMEFMKTIGVFGSSLTIIMVIPYSLFPYHESTIIQK